MTTTESVSGAGEIDFSDLEAKYQVSLDECYDNILIIDNLPLIDESKEEKLMAVLKKNLFKPAGASLIANGYMMPRDPSTRMSRGYLFAEFETVEQAAAVLKVANGYRLDKQHVLSALKFTDFDRLREMDESFVEPEIEPFVEKEFLKSWLLDARARDQFVTCSGNQTSIYFNNRLTAPEQVYSRANWTDGAVKWSPRGSYLLTFHAQGVALWGGASWTRLFRFPHAQVKGAFFSPLENYLVTQSVFNPAAPTEPNVFVWDVATCKVLRAFVVEDVSSLEAAEKCSVIQWSFDDSHASRLAGDHVAVYELPSFSLLDKTGIKVDNVRLVSWSPCDLKLVYWVPGTESIPSRVALWHLPTRQLIRAKNLFNVHDVQVHWHPDGEFMAVQVDRYAHKNKKSLTTNIELFRLKVRDVPVEVVDCGGTDRVDHFSWEPQGSRFLTNQTVEFRSIVSVFQVTASAVKSVRTLERKQLTRWAWSPRGNFFVLAGLDSTAAFLEFWSADEGTCMSVKEHFMATDLEWDPSGRFVASWVSYWRHQMENGFMLWDFRGELVAKQMQPRFTAFAWRPRPPSPLSKEQLRDIRKNLKTLAVRFEQEDAASQQQSTTDTTELKKRLLEEWVIYRMKCQEAYEARAKQRQALCPAVAAAAAEGAATAATESKIVQEWVEDEVLEVLEEVIPE